jgi:hypothetical protein
MPDPSVQPPEGLRQELISVVADRFAVSSFHGPFVDIDATPVNVVDAVLAALLDACEIRERWGTRWTLADGRTADGVVVEPRGGGDGAGLADFGEPRGAPPSLRSSNPSGVGVPVPGERETLVADADR